MSLCGGKVRRVHHQPTSSWAPADSSGACVPGTGKRVGTPWPKYNLARPTLELALYSYYTKGLNMWVLI